MLMIESISAEGLGPHYVCISIFPACIPPTTSSLCSRRKWLEGAVSVLTFISVPVMSGLSDTVGRRGVISWAYVLHAASVCVLAATPNALESVIFCQVMAGLCSVIIPVSQAIMVDVAG